MAANFLHQPGTSIPNACGDRAGTKACYRLFDHQEVTATAILEAHREATFGRLTVDDEAGFLLVVQDTSALNFSTPAPKWKVWVPRPVMAAGKPRDFSCTAIWW